MKKLCLIIPYRNRQEHLDKNIPILKEYLKNINNTIYVIEQNDQKPFNRGKLLNIGFDINKEQNDYFCFHDVDMVPINADYSYSDSVVHIATRAEQFNYNMPYPDYFGGVTIFARDTFKKINGFSNEFWGWGAEDDDLRDRCDGEKIKIERRLCIFKSLYHKPSGEINGGKPSSDTIKNRERYFYNKKNNKYYYKEEGLNSLNYKINSIEEKQNFILVKTDI